MSSSKQRPLPQSLGLPFTGADSHAHLDDERLLPDLSGMLERAASSGVSLIVHMFLQHERYAANRDAIFEAAAALPEAPDICFARGLHPEDVLRADEQEWEHLVDAVKNDPLIRAVGEIGLDYHYDVLKSHPEWIQDCKAIGLTVNVWTVNEPEKMREMVERGVDFITTDLPEQAEAIIREQAR